MLCHSFLIGKGTHVYVRTYTCTYYKVMSQLSDWKRAHMRTENHVCFGRIHGSQCREGANEGQPPTRMYLLCHNFLIGKGTYRYVPLVLLATGHNVRTRDCILQKIHNIIVRYHWYHGTMVRTMVHVYHGTMVSWYQWYQWYVPWYIRTRVPLVRTYNVMSQLSDCVYVRTYHGTYIMLCHNFLIGKGHTCAPRTTCVLGGYTAASIERERMQGHHCLNGEVYRGNRHYNVCERACRLGYKPEPASPP
jgi:hypothetical protein